MDGHSYGFQKKVNLESLQKKLLNYSESKILENIVFNIIKVLLNTFQSLLVIIVGLTFNALDSIVILSLVFWSFRAKYKTKHFAPTICTIITISYYIIASMVINKLYIIQFMPVVLGVTLFVLTAKNKSDK